jgi:hypothetical protein
MKRETRLLIERKREIKEKLGWSKERERGFPPPPLQLHHNHHKPPKKPPSIPLHTHKQSYEEKIINPQIHNKSAEKEITNPTAPTYRQQHSLKINLIKNFS